MDNRLGAKFNMYQAVGKVFEVFPEAVTLNPVFKSESDSFIANIPEIRRIDTLIGDDHTLITTSKSQTKDLMLDLTLLVAQNMKAVGIKTKDDALKSAGQFTKSTLAAGKEEDCLQRCTRIAQKGREILPALNERGMDTTVLEDLEETIETFKDKKPEPQSIRQEKMSWRTQLATLFDENDSLLELMLLSLGNFKSKNPLFCERFTAATVIQDAPKKTTKGKFLPENALTGVPITNFTIYNAVTGFKATVKDIENPALAIKAESDAQFVLTAEGFAPATVEHLKIMRGQVNRIVVKMTPL